MLWNLLYNYTGVSSTSYDPDFTDEIRAVAPHWFRSVTPDEKKVKLLMMARGGEPRPACENNELGRALGRYTFRLGSCYDPDFTDEIRAVAPHWFRRRRK